MMSSLFSGKSQEKGVELAVHISENVPQKLIGDPGRFRQIITNLMGNSVTVSYLRAVHTFSENFVFESQAAIIILDLPSWKENCTCYHLDI
ncbi:hypothetical protein EUGRSUZ_K00060 [Eucalyptus grandis]|uniref:histidine kinase n=2 Tax=Eucalyptus grandis TaxID=71139 RepID=A0A058ZWI2_EUCGR|nr:hypothetical protein EUGRSUZ_K00060 [Eucalyptus grandis]